MKRIVLLAACLAIISSAARAGELYRWMDTNGIVHYSDTPPPHTEQAEIIKISNSAGSDEDLSFETRRAKQNFPVTLYVGSTCDELCDHGRSLLSKRGIPFTVKVMKTKEDVEALKQLSGIEGLPMLAVGKTYLGGFLAERWQSELDVTGYPKTAPYRAPGKPSEPDAASAVVPANPTSQ